MKNVSFILQKNHMYFLASPIHIWGACSFTQDLLSCLHLVFLTKVIRWPKKGIDHVLNLIWYALSSTLCKIMCGALWETEVVHKLCTLLVRGGTKMIQKGKDFLKDVKTKYSRSLELYTFSDKTESQKKKMNKRIQTQKSIYCTILFIWCSNWTNLW